MIGILIIAHGNLGDALINCMTHVLGKRPEGIASMQVAGTDSPRELMPSAQRMINALDEGDGVLRGAWKLSPAPMCQCWCVPSPTVPAAWRPC